MPPPDIGMEDIPELVQLVNNDNNDEDLNEPPFLDGDSVDEGDCIFVVTIPCEAEFIHTMSNISQWLAEAFHKNVQPQSFHKSVPVHFYNFEDLFTKSSFGRLPDRKVWDHAIELIPGAKAASCKVYPLVPNEQVEMDEFIQEH
jgi:hypothetical protein